MKTQTLIRSTCAAALVLAAVGSVSGVASAESHEPVAPESEVYVTPSSTVPPETMPEVLAETQQRDESSSPPAAAADAEPDSLAFTGSDATGLAVVGGSALAVGVAITVARRRTAGA